MTTRTRSLPASKHVPDIQTWFVRSAREWAEKPGDRAILVVSGHDLQDSQHLATVLRRWRVPCAVAAHRLGRAPYVIHEEKELPVLVAWYRYDATSMGPGLHLLEQVTERGHDLLIDGYLSPLWTPGENTW